MQLISIYYLQLNVVECILITWNGNNDIPAGETQEAKPMDELNEYDFEVHFINLPYRELKRYAKTQSEALAIAENDYKDEIGYSTVISVDQNKL